VVVGPPHGFDDGFLRCHEPGQARVTCKEECLGDKCWQQVSAKKCSCFEYQGFVKELAVFGYDGASRADRKDDYTLHKFILSL